MKRPLSWIAEEYAFVTCALRDEIKRRKESGEKHGVINSLTIRILVVWGIVMSIFFSLAGIIIQNMKLRNKTDYKHCNES